MSRTDKLEAVSCGLRKVIHQIKFILEDHENALSFHGCQSEDESLDCSHQRAFEFYQEDFFRWKGIKDAFVDLIDQFDSPQFAVPTTLDEIHLRIDVLFNNHMADAKSMPEFYNSTWSQYYTRSLQFIKSILPESNEKSPWNIANIRPRIESLSLIGA